MSQGSVPRMISATIIAERVACACQPTQRTRRSRCCFSVRRLCLRGCSQSYFEPHCSSSSIPSRSVRFSLTLSVSTELFGLLGRRTRYPSSTYMGHLDWPWKPIPFPCPCLHDPLNCCVLGSLAVDHIFTRQFWKDSQFFHPPGW